MISHFSDLFAVLGNRNTVAWLTPPSGVGDHRLRLFDLMIDGLAIDTLSMLTVNAYAMAHSPGAVGDL
jgi:hypothetical protein